MSFFDQKFIDPNPPIFGLDLSDLSIKVVQISNHRGYAQIDGVHSVDLPQGAVVDGQIVKPEIVIQAIIKARKSAGITVRHVICSLPETKAFLRIISIPQMTKNEVGEAIKWEMEANIPMAIDQVYYDWQILSSGIANQKGHMSVLVVAVAHHVVDKFTEVLEGAGLIVRGFEVESMAQARSLIVHDLMKTTLIVDIGDRRTSFLIVVNGVPVFTSSIPLSAETMTVVIAKDFGLSHVEAEKVKFAHGIGSVLKNDHIFQAMKPVVQSFVTEIEKSINFYLTELRYSKAIDTVILCGGGAKTKGLIPFLSQALGREITLGDPWSNVEFKTLPSIDRESSVQYATVIGLATQNYQK